MAKAITAEMLDRATRCIDSDGHTFYRMTSGSDATITYTIRAVTVNDGLGNTKRVLRCDCPAVGNCYHIRTVLLHNKQYNEDTKPRVVEAFQFPDTGDGTNIASFKVQAGLVAHQVMAYSTGLICDCQGATFMCDHVTTVLNYLRAQDRKQAKQQVAA